MSTLNSSFPMLGRRAGSSSRNEWRVRSAQSRRAGSHRSPGLLLGVLLAVQLVLAPENAAGQDSNVLIENNVLTGALWNFTPHVLESSFSSKEGVGMSGARFIGAWPYQHTGFSLGLKAGSQDDRRASASYKILDGDTGEVLGGFTLSFKGFRDWNFEAAADLLLHQTKSFVVKSTKSNIKSEINDSISDLFEDTGRASAPASTATSPDFDWKKHLKKITKKAALATGAFDGLDEVEAAIDVIKEIAKIIEALDPSASVHVEIENYQASEIPFELRYIEPITIDTSTPGTVNIQVIAPAGKLLSDGNAFRFFVVALGATGDTFPGFIDMSVSPFCDFVCSAWRGTEDLLASLAYPTASCSGAGPNLRFVAPGFQPGGQGNQVDLKIAWGSGGWSEPRPSQPYPWVPNGTTFSGWVRSSNGQTLCKTENDAEKFIVDSTAGCNQTILVDCDDDGIRWTQDNSPCAHAETIESVPYYKIALDRGAGLVRQNFRDFNDPTGGPALVSGPTEWVCPTPPVLEPWNPTPTSCAGNMSVTFLPIDAGVNGCIKLESSSHQLPVLENSCAQQFINVPDGTVFGGEIVENNSPRCSSEWSSGGTFTLDAGSGCNQVVYVSCTAPGANPNLEFEPVDLSLACGVTDPLSLLPATCKDSICGTCPSKTLPAACPSSSSPRSPSPGLAAAAPRGLGGVR